MPRVGLIIDLDEEKGLAYISTSRRGVCESCGESSSCSIDGSDSSETAEVVTAANDINACTGDTVEFELAGHTELKISLIVWIVPLIGLFAGTFSGSSLAVPFGVSEDAGTLIGAVLGFLVAYMMIMVYDRMMKNDPQLTPHVIRVLHSSCVVNAPNKSIEV